jgi:hypothetical protein
MEIITIRVRRRNLRLLGILKKKMKAKSYDEVLARLLLEKLDIEDSMFGADRGRISRFKEEDRL